MLTIRMILHLTSTKVHHLSQYGQTSRHFSYYSTSAASNPHLDQVKDDKSGNCIVAGDGAGHLRGDIRSGDGGATPASQAFLLRNKCVHIYTRAKYTHLDLCTVIAEYIRLLCTVGITQYAWVCTGDSSPRCTVGRTRPCTILHGFFKLFPMALLQCFSSPLICRRMLYIKFGVESDFLRTKFSKRHM